MDIRDYLAVCRAMRGRISEAELARRIGQTPQNLSNKLTKETLRAVELVEIAEALGCDVKFVDKVTKEIIA